MASGRIWEIDGDLARIISISPISRWETDEDLLGAADTVLSAASQNLTNEIPEPSKTVFSVPSFWVSEGQIKDEYLEKIRKVCGDLSLDPVGFVVLPEAIAHFFKAEEGTPLNAVVLGTGQENVEVSVFKLGNLMGTYSVVRSVSVADDVLEGLTRFGQTEPLPSRFILYDGKEGELENIRQELLAVSWDSEKVKFLHTPKIEIVGGNKKILATALAGASEIANVSSIEYKEEKFESGEETSIEGSSLENLSYPQAKVSAEELGFVIGEDVKNTQKVNAQKDSESYQEQNITTKVLARSEQKESLLGRLRNSLISFSKKLKPSLSEESHVTVHGINKINRVKRIFILGGIFLIILAAGGFAFWWYYPKATVTIYVSPKKLEEKTIVFVDPSVSSSDFTKSLLPGELIKSEISGEKTISTTGVKTVGEKAKGSFKVENGTDQIINLSRGAIFVSADGLKFTSELEASVSAALSPSSPGTSIVDATAFDIGAEYNLAKDERFKVGNYPKTEVDAISVADLSGGSSRQILAVSVDDQKNLEKDLTDELFSKNKGKLKADSPSDKFFIEESLTATPSSRVFSNKVGDEASNLNLSLGLKVNGLRVGKDTLLDLAIESVKNKIPQGYVLRNNDVNLNLELKGMKNGVYQFDLAINVNLLPEVRPDEIAKKVTGKYPQLALSYLTSVPGFSRAEIKLKPNFPGKLGTLPWVTKNITIEVAAEK